MSFFGYTNPAVLSRHQKPTPSDSTNIYNGSWVQRMENFKDLKEMFGEYPRVKKTVIPSEFNDFTTNSIILSISTLTATAKRSIQKTNSLEKTSRRRNIN